MSENNELLSTWIENYSVKAFEVDFTGKTPLHSICNFLQEAAWTHANHLGFGYFDMIRNKQVWVLSRLYLQIYKFPKMGDKIKIKTWPSGIEGLFALRDYSILDEDDNVICAAVSAWLIINLETRRPIRVESALTYLIPDKPNRSLDIKLDKLPAPLNHSITSSVTVKYGDIDVNNHVNNTKYIEWILNSFPLNFLESKIPTELEINFLSETFYDDKIDILTENKDNLSYIFSLLRESDKKEICRARINWK
jgi:medium-chain acyl-[acyl-carrier-protein] hydrolase